MDKSTHQLIVRLVAFHLQLHSLLLCERGVWGGGAVLNCSTHFNH